MASRRTLLGAAVLALAPAAVNSREAKDRTETPIAGAGKQIAVLDKLDDDSGRASEQQTRIARAVCERDPETIGDAAILLMAAVADINVDDMDQHWLRGSERAEVVVSRVMHFLADAAGIDLLDHGASWYLPAHGYKPHRRGSVVEAAKQLHGMDAAKAEGRRARYSADLALLIRRAENRREAEARSLA